MLVDSEPAKQVIIRQVQTLEDYYAIEDIQRKAWDVPDRVIVPANMLITANKHGGLALGAFLPTTDDNPLETPVGFAFGFLCSNAHGTIRFCSHMVGVLPGYQNLHIGYQLKCVQRTWALARGIGHITWTFDPLESRNGYLNVHKLGATCTTYLRNVYGIDPFTNIHTALPSDRFQVDWFLVSRHVVNRLTHFAHTTDDTDNTDNTLDNLLSHHIPCYNPLTLPDMPSLKTNASPRVLVEIPARFSDIKRTSPTVAMEWRQQSRLLFEWLFAHRYTVVNLLCHLNDRCYYVLEQHVVL